MTDNPELWDDPAWEEAVARLDAQKKQAEQILDSQISNDMAINAAEIARMYPNLMAGVVGPAAFAGLDGKNPALIEIAARVQEQEPEGFFHSLTTPLRGVARLSALAFESAVDELWDRPIRMATRMIQGGESLVDAYRRSGSSGLARVTREIAQGRAGDGLIPDLNIGEGWLPQSVDPFETADYYADIRDGMDAQTAANRALERTGTPITLQEQRVQDSTLYRTKAGNLTPMSLGRLAAVQVTEPGTQAFHYLSGAIDFGKQLWLDPAAGAFHVISGANAARRTFQVAAFADDAYKSGLIARGLRKAIYAPTVQAWKATPRGVRFREMLVELDSIEDVHHVFPELSARDKLLIANADDIGLVDAVLDRVLGLEVTRVPTVVSPPVRAIGRAFGAGDKVASEIGSLRGPATVFRYRASDSALGRGLSNLPRSYLSPEDIDEAFENARDFMIQAQIPKTVRNTVLRDIARLEQGDYAGMYATSRNMMNALNNRLRQMGYPEEVLKSYTELFKTQAKIRAYLINSVGQDVHLPGSVTLTLDDGTEVAVPVASLLSEMTARTIILPDPYDVLRMNSRVRRRTDALRRAVNMEPLYAQENKLAAAGSFYYSRIWKPLVLLRPAWTVRVVGEELLRMAASGYDSLYKHPFSYLSWTVGERVLKPLENATGIRIAKGRTGITQLTDGSYEMLLETPHGRAAMSRLRERILARHGPDAARHPTADWTAAHKRHEYMRWREGIAREFMQLYGDPVTRQIAQHGPEAALNWLRTSSDGKDTLAFIARQAGPQSPWADIATNPHTQQLFVEQANYRLHIKTGGSGISIDANGRFIDNRGIEVERPDAMTDGVTFYVDGTGNQELIDAVASGRLRDVAMSDNMTMRQYRKLRDTIADNFYDELPEFAKAPVTVDNPRVGSRMFDDFTTQFFQVLGERPTNYLSRSPAFLQMYWEEIGRMALYSNRRTRLAILEAARSANLERELLRSMAKHAEMAGLDQKLIRAMKKGDIVDLPEPQRVNQAMRHIGYVPQGQLPAGPDAWASDTGLGPGSPTGGVIVPQRQRWQTLTDDQIIEVEQAIDDIYDAQHLESILTEADQFGMSGADALLEFLDQHPDLRWLLDDPQIRAIFEERFPYQVDRTPKDITDTYRYSEGDVIYVRRESMESLFDRSRVEIEPDENLLNTRRSEYLPALGERMSRNMWDAVEQIADYSQPLTRQSMGISQNTLDALLKRGWIVGDEIDGTMRYWLSPLGRKALNQQAVLSGDPIDAFASLNRRRVDRLKDGAGHWKFQGLKQAGVKEPLTVVKKDGSWLLGDGHHRLAAARELGIDWLPIEVHPDWVREGDEFAQWVARNQDEFKIRSYDPVHPNGAPSGSYIVVDRDMLRGATGTAVPQLGLESPYIKALPNAEAAEDWVKAMNQYSLYDSPYQAKGLYVEGFKGEELYPDEIQEAFSIALNEFERIGEGELWRRIAASDDEVKLAKDGYSISLQLSAREANRFISDAFERLSDMHYSRTAMIVTLEDGRRIVVPYSELRKYAQAGGPRLGRQMEIIPADTHYLDETLQMRERSTSPSRDFLGPMESTQEGMVGGAWTREFIDIAARRLRGRAQGASKHLLSAFDSTLDDVLDPHELARLRTELQMARQPAPTYWDEAIDGVAPHGEMDMVDMLPIEQTDREWILRIMSGEEHVYAFRIEDAWEGSTRELFEMYADSYGWYRLTLANGDIVYINPAYAPPPPPKGVAKYVEVPEPPTGVQANYLDLTEDQWKARVVSVEGQAPVPPTKPPKPPQPPTGRAGRWFNDLPEGSLDDIDMIDELAKERALAGVQNLLYDLSRKHGWTAGTRLVFPFGEAWAEILTRWAQIIAKNPKVIRRGQQIFLGAREQGFIYTDDYGNEVFAYPFQEQLASLASSRLGGAVLGGATGGALGGLIGGPVGMGVGAVAGAAAGMSPQVQNIAPKVASGNLKLTGNVQSLNLIAQGYMPAFGPTIQGPASVWLPKGRLGDAITETLFPYGKPQAGLSLGYAVDIATPAWMRKFLTAANEEDGDMANAYASASMSIYSVGVMEGWYTGTKEMLQAEVDDAKDKARDLFIIRGALQSTLPTGPNVAYSVHLPPAIPGDELANARPEIMTLRAMMTEYQKLLGAYQGDHVAASRRFIQMFGVDPLFQASKSWKITESSSQEEGFQWWQHNGDLWDLGAYPYTAYYAHPDRPGYDFLWEAYAEQFRTGQRIMKTPEQYALDINRALGQRYYDEMSQKVEGRTDKAADDWKKAHRKLAEGIWPGFGTQFNIPGKPASPTFAQKIEEFKRWGNEPRLANTDAGQGLAKFLVFWDKAEAQALTRGYSVDGWMNAKGMSATHDWLRDWAEKIIVENPDFLYIWTSTFKPELEVQGGSTNELHLLDTAVTSEPPALGD